MPETPASLLERCCASSDPAVWEQLVSLYTPLIHHWLRQFRVRAQDADELCQEILMVVVRELPRFHR
jgi:RNA polymerase sigma-70 factor, ECF subfamily